jgi:hypothetical protein
MSKLARAEPRQTRPSGIEASPMKAAVSKMKASGGSPSGAEEIFVDGTWTKSPFSEGMRTTMKEKMIVMEGGVAADFRNVIM